MKPRRQADSIRKELVKLDQRREALAKLLAVYEELDVLDQQGRNSSQNTPQGTRSLRGAVLEMLCEAERPLMPKEIWIRLKAQVPEMRFHDLRHAHATLLLTMGVQSKVVSDRLGHSGIQVTMDTYGHVMAGVQAEAIKGLDRVVAG